MCVCVCVYLLLHLTFLGVLLCFQEKKNKKNQAFLYLHPNLYINWYLLFMVFVAKKDLAFLIFVQVGDMFLKAKSRSTKISRATRFCFRANVTIVLWKDEPRTVHLLIQDRYGSLGFSFSIALSVAEVQNRKLILTSSEWKIRERNIQLWDEGNSLVYISVII